MKKSRSRKDEFAEFEHRPAQDFDPEDDLQAFVPGGSSSESDQEPDHGFTGREHYTAVGKSKLRNQLPGSLGPRYEGSRVSRLDAQSSDENDPFAGHDEDESQEGVSVDTDDDSEDDEEVVQIGTDASSVEDKSSEGEQDHLGNGVASAESKNREELLRLMNDDSKAITATITQANKDDAQKGVAVKRQRDAFDSLLNARIRLQSGLVSLNSMALAGKDAGSGGPQKAIAAAESAAQTLWNNLESLRQSLQEAKSGVKRKRFEASREIKSSALWKHMKGHESNELEIRRSNLSKWSLKTQPASIQTTKSKLDPSIGPSTILDSVDSQLANPDRLVKRTRLARSCAPLQVSNKISESSDIYDDADFYGVLLKELLEQRNAAAASNIQFDRIAEQWQAAREAKTKKSVDTKASKGRKLRYTVHEKLQNFMAPENRCTWEERQIDELFGSLLGKRFALDENAREDGGEEEMLGEEEQALKLFRS